MLIWTARLSKRKLLAAAIAAGTVLTLLLCTLSQHEAPQTMPAPRLSENPERIAYLRSFGWEVHPEPVETLQFLLPETLEEPYLTYNRLQREQGFGLSCACGKQLTRYTYTVTNYPQRPEGVQLNLYVCDEAAVAGDVFCAGADGFQGPLTFPGK